MQSRRAFIRHTTAVGALLTASSVPGAGWAEGRRSGSQRRWRTAIGLNGFMSSEQQFGKNYPIWEVMEFAQREGFEGVELVDGWPEPYPSLEDANAIRSLRSFHARYNVKPFSIQIGAGGAFRADRGARRSWVRRFSELVRFASMVGCECVGLWPGGGLDGQTLVEARDRLIESLREGAKSLADEGILASVEIEPPFKFRTIEDLIAIVDGVDHPLVKGMYDPSHYDLMNGGTGRPEELLKRLGVERVGYIHLTDTDGTEFGGTSKHLPCGEGHVDIRESLRLLWEGGYEGWIMIDAWKTEDPYHASRRGREAIESAQREFRGISAR